MMAIPGVWTIHFSSFLTVVEEEEEECDSPQGDCGVDNTCQELSPEEALQEAF